MQDRTLWGKWLKMLLIALVAATPTLMLADDYDDDDDEGDDEQEQGDWLTAKGKGVTKKGAMTNAYKTGIKSYVKDNWRDDDYANFRDQIDDYLTEGWKDYIVGDWEKPKILKQWTDKGFMTITFRIKGDRLMADLKQKFQRADTKLNGFVAVIVVEKEPKEISGSKFADIGMSSIAVQDEFGKWGGRVYSVSDIKLKMEAENRALGRSVHSDPEGFAMQYFNEINLVVYLTVYHPSGPRVEPNGDHTAITIIRSRCIWRQTAEILWDFTVRSGERISDEKIAPGPKTAFSTVNFGDLVAQDEKALGLFTAKEMVERLANRKNILDEKTYTFKFANLTNKQAEKVKSAISDLEGGKRPYLKVLSSKGADAQFFEITVKWLQDAASQEKIGRIVEEVCADNEVKVRADKYSNRVFYFEPGVRK